MYYSLHHKPPRFAKFSKYTTYIIIGLLIGLYLGFEYAVATLPLPTNETIYITGRGE